MILIRRLLPVLLGLVTLGWSHVALAQITLTQEIPSETPRQNNPEIISKEDCDTTSVDWTFSGIDSGDNVSVWVSQSTDCSVAINRTMAGSLCFDTEISFKGSTSQNTTVTAELSTLLNSFPDVNECVDELNNQDGRNLTIYFLVNVSGADTTNFTTSMRYTQFDLVGASPPKLDRLVSSDETLLEAELTLNESTDIQNYKIYCERVGDAPEGTGGASTSTTTTSSVGGTGGTGAGGAVGGAGGLGGIGGSGGSGDAAGGDDGGTGGTAPVAECSSLPMELAQGEVPPTDLLRGTGTSDSILAEGLDEGEWACGVAGTDTLGNPGVLSNVVCAVPKPVTDFFEAYRQAGGLAGGGFCQCSLPGADHEHDWAAWAAAVLALSLTVRRKARERIRR